MDMSAHLLTRLGGAEYTDNGKLRGHLLRRAIVSEELGIEFCRRCLIVVDTIYTHAEEVHCGVVEARGSRASKAKAGRMVKLC